MTDESIFDRSLMDEAVSLAEMHMRRLYEIPERAFQEVKTTAYIKEVCGNYPLETIDIGMETGFVCLLDAGAADTVALRTDIDAVPTDEGPRHLCGHNAHAGTMLGAVHYLCGVRDSLKHNVLFIFQPAEEGTRGAREMISHGLFEKLSVRPSQIYAIHNRPEINVGDVVVHKGPLMSEKSVFDIRINGRAAHASMPQLSADPIVCAAAVVQSLQTVVSRNTNPLDAVILTINMIEGGSPMNLVTDKVLMRGSVRSLSDTALDRAIERVAAIAEKTAEAYECRAEILWNDRIPAVWNSPEMTALAKKCAAATGCEVTDAPPSLASEDFSRYRAFVPSFFYWVGSTAAGDEPQELHKPRFHTDDTALRHAAELYAVSAMLP